MNEFLAASSLANTANLSVWLTISLGHFLWQGLVWAGLSAAFGKLLSRSSAQARYLVHVASLAGMTLGFAATSWMCRPVSFISTTQPVEVSSTLRTEASVERMVRQEPSAEATTPTASPLDRDVATSTVTGRIINNNAGNAAVRPWHSVWTGIVNRVAPWTALIYLTGVLLMVGRLLMGMFGGNWLSRTSLPVTDANLLRLLEHQVARMGLRVTPVLLWCQQASVPLVVGILKPAILLPISLSSGLSPDQVSAILAHELAHVRRGDLIINLFQRAAEAVLFFHPAVWYVSQRIRVERENCCDDCVISAGCDRVVYVDALLRMAELSVWQRGSTLNMATVAATGNSSSEFKHRILRLLSVPADSAISVSRTSVWMLATLGAIGLSTFLIAQEVRPNKPAQAVDPKPASVTAVASKQLAPLTAIVVESDGTPVPSMAVTGYSYDGRSIKTLNTDTQGQVQIPWEWAIGDEAQGKWVTLLAGDSRQHLAWYSFRHQHYLTRQSQMKGKPAPVSTSPLRLVLMKFDRTIRGRMVDGQQKGLPNIQVAIKDLSSQQTGVSSYGAFRAPGLPLPTTVTDSEGRFEFHVPAGFSVGAVTTSNDYSQAAIHWRDSQTEIPDQILQPGGRVKGVVKEAVTGKAVPGAIINLRGISLSGNWGSFAQVIAGANGEFESPALLPDHYKVSVHPPEGQPHLVPAQPVRANVTIGKTATAVVLMTEGTVIQGSCVDGKSDRPVANESIRLLVKMNRNPRAETDYGNVTKTDIEGKFQFVSPPGMCTVYSDSSSQRQPHSDDRRIIQLQQGQAPAELVLRLGPPVTRNSGSTVEVRAAEEKVEVKQPGGTVPPRPVRPKLTVELIAPDNLAVGEYIVRAAGSRSNYVSETSVRQGTKFEKEFAEYEVGGRQKLLIDIPGFTPVWTDEYLIEPRMAVIKVPLQLEEYVTIQGRVLDSSQRELAGARVRVRRIFLGQDTEFPWGPETITGADGRYTLNHIRRGEDVVLVIDHERQPLGKTESKLYRVKDTQPITVPDLVLSVPDQDVAGVVTDQDGIPIPGTTVTFESHPPRETKTDAEGKFKLTGLPHGRLELKFKTTDSTVTESGISSGTLDAKVFIPLRSLYDRPENTLRLTLKPPDGAAKSKWRYYLINADRPSVSLWASRDLSGQTVEKMDLGSFLRKPPAPHLKLAVVAGGYKLTPPISLILRPKLDPLTINLEPAPSPKLTIKVIDQSDKPVAGAKLGERIHLTSEISHNDFQYISNVPPVFPETNAEGIYEFHDFPLGTQVSFYTNAPGFAGRWSDRLTLDKDTALTLKLTPATRVITGQVQDTSGAPITDALVGVHDFSRVRTTTGPGGKFRIGAAPDGDLIVFVRAFGYHESVTRILEKDAAQSVTFKLKRAKGVQLPDK